MIKISGLKFNKGSGDYHFFGNQYTGGEDGDGRSFQLFCYSNGNGEGKGIDYCFSYSHHGKGWGDGCYFGGGTGNGSGKGIDSLYFSSSSGNGYSWSSHSLKKEFLNHD